MSNVPETVVVSQDGYSLPVIEVLTGRGFITGKSGSGKSNTASVVAEELLACGVSLLIVDTDGEYYGLKEQYDVLHAGADDDCDVQVGAEDADEIAETAVVENVPVILDVSGFLDGATVDEVVKSVVEALFRVEKEERKPFLLFVEEVHEFIPETGGLDDLGEMLIRVAKRGRKRGLGLVGMSQRPAAVDKDFITQCDWLVWHRLTWENDTKVAGQIMGSDYSDAVQDLDTGEAFVMTDWDETITRVQWRRKRTLDAGATPGLDALGDTDPEPQGSPEDPVDPPPEGDPGVDEPPDDQPADGDPAAADAEGAGSEPAGPEPPDDPGSDGASQPVVVEDADDQPARGADQSPTQAGQPANQANQPANQANQPARQAGQPAGGDNRQPSRQPAGQDNRTGRAASGGRERSLAARARRDSTANGEARDRGKRPRAESHPSDDPPVRVLWEFGQMMTHAAWAAGSRVAAALRATVAWLAAVFRAAASGLAAALGTVAGWLRTAGGWAGSNTRALVRRESGAGDSFEREQTGDTLDRRWTGAAGRSTGRDDRLVAALVLLALAVGAGLLAVAAL